MLRSFATLTFTLMFASTSLGAAGDSEVVTRLSVDQKVLATFDPNFAFGGTVDVHGRGETAKIYTPANIRAMRSAGFHRLSYRLATELNGDAWHWNPKGHWSDAAHARGYWISDSTSVNPIEVSYGYHLPRRGNSVDQSQNQGYSRITDGDVSSFWKSNPYLPDRPQWIILDLGAPAELRSLRIAWGVPFATHYVVQWWEGVHAMTNPNSGRWVDFENGTIRDGHGGDVTLQLSTTPHHSQWVRIWMTGSSSQAPAGALDPRDAVGYAVREVWLDDHVRHGKSRESQTETWVSSTDPWHRATDVDYGLEQPGLDRVFRSGLPGGRGVLTPVSLLYGTPEDSAAEIRYLLARGYNLSGIELGEEPDGQYVVPDDYAALYVRWADALHAVDAGLKLGGPAFQGTDNVTVTWREGTRGTSWMARFLDALRERGHSRDFSFFSFEWYPFDEVCEPGEKLLPKTSLLLQRVLTNWRDEGVPQNIPWIASEYGWSSFAGKAEVDMTEALFNSEFVAEFLSSGGGAAYFYGLEPDVPITETECGSYGNLMLFLSDSEHHIRARLPAFHAAELMTKRWTMPEGGPHELHAVAGTSALLEAFAVKRPDGHWSMLIVNKDPDHEARVLTFDGEVEVDQYSTRDYEWHAEGEKGHPTRNVAPHRWTTAGAVMIEPYSLTVITTK